MIKNQNLHGLCGYIAGIILYLIVLGSCTTNKTGSGLKSMMIRFLFISVVEHNV